MCKRAYCEHCEKLTFTGCGKHLDVVFRNVPESDRCRCRELRVVATEAPIALAPRAAAA